MNWLPSINDTTPGPIVVNSLGTLVPFGDVTVNNVFELMPATTSSGQPSGNIPVGGTGTLEITTSIPNEPGNSQIGGSFADTAPWGDTGSSSAYGYFLQPTLVAPQVTGHGPNDFLPTIEFTAPYVAPGQTETIDLQVGYEYGAVSNSGNYVLAQTWAAGIANDATPITILVEGAPLPVVAPTAQPVPALTSNTASVPALTSPVVTASDSASSAAIAVNTATVASPPNPVFIDQNEASVIRLYGTTLDRLPDATGLAGWTSILDSGQETLAQVSDGFTNSPEFIANYGVPNNQAFVDLLYQNVLGRVADQVGEMNWTNALNNGVLARSGVVLGFSDSVENIARTAGIVANYGTVV